jgi:hypothetical protein
MLIKGGACQEWMRRGEGKSQKKTKPPLTRTRLFTHSRLIQCLTQWGLFSGAALYGGPTKRDL